MVKRLIHERREFIKWLISPDEERDTNTQKAFAKKWGLAEETVCRWRHDPEVVAEVNRLVDEHFADDYATMANALKREAAHGSYNHLRMYFEMLGKYTPKQTTTVEMTGGISLYLPKKGSLDDSNGAGDGNPGE